MSVAGTDGCWVWLQTVTKSSRETFYFRGVNRPYLVFPNRAISDTNDYVWGRRNNEVGETKDYILPFSD